MSYADVIDWAGEDFDRRGAVAKARDYRPEWIANGIIDRPLEAKILERMIAEAGPFLSRRCRWIMRLIKIKPLTEEELATMAVSVPEYRDLQQIERAVRNDTSGLSSLGLVRSASIRTLSRPSRDLE